MRRRRKREKGEFSNRLFNRKVVEDDTQGTHELVFSLTMTISLFALLMVQVIEASTLDASQEPRDCIFWFAIRILSSSRVLIG
jgi:hypothetical protein